MSAKPAVDVRFSTPICRAQVADFGQHQAALVGYFMGLYERGGGAGVSRSNCKGWHSAPDLHAHEEPAVRWLFGELIARSTECLEILYRGPLPGPLRLIESWVNVNPAGAWNEPHMHAGPLWSGVIPIQAEHSVRENSNAVSDGSLVLLNPAPQAEALGQPSNYSVDPRDGQLVLFPGYLYHMVAPHESSVPRISVAFNLTVQR